MSPKLEPEVVRDLEVLLEERLVDERRQRRKAERVARISLVLATAALLGSVMMWFTAQNAGGPGIRAGVVRTRDLRLQDGEGRTRGRWQVQPGGLTRLAFLDQAGRERMRFTMLENGATGITLADSRGEGRVVLSLEGGAGSRFTFADAAGTPRMVLGLSPQQAGTLIFADDGGVPRAAFGMEEDGSGTFLLPNARSAPADEPVDTTAGGN